MQVVRRWEIRESQIISNILNDFIILTLLVNFIYDLIRNNYSLLFSIKN